MILAIKIKILIKYLNFSEVFLEKIALVLLKIIKLKQYVIKLQERQQLFYKPIYSFGLVKLKTLKTYTKYNLANKFIGLLKLPVSAFIFYV